MESNKEDKLSKIDEHKKELEDGIPELLELKTIQEYWDSFHDDEPLAS